MEAVGEKEGIGERKLCLQEGGRPSSLQGAIFLPKELCYHVKRCLQMTLSKKKKTKSNMGGGLTKKKRKWENSLGGENCSRKHEKPQIESRAEETLTKQDRTAGEFNKKKNPLTFLNNSCTTHSSSLLPSVPLSPPRTPISYYSSPTLLSSENRPEARNSPGWLTLKQGPCSSHAGNNLCLLKESRLLERSTCGLLAPPPSPPCLTLSALKASGLFPRCHSSTRLHVSAPLPP